MERPSVFIGFVDSDDWIEPDMFEILLGYAEESGSKVVGCGILCEYQSQVAQIKLPFIGDKMLNSTEAISALIKGNIGKSVWCKLWKKECFADIRFPQGHVFEDAATIYRVFYNIKSFRSIPCALYHYRIRKGSICNTHSVANCIDLWLAHKSRFDYFCDDCRFNTDNEIMEKLLFYCAFAIKSTWLWYFASTKEEREKYSLQMGEMRDFSQ